jgi:outer membrane protein assembly factor BamB
VDGALSCVDAVSGAARWRCVIDAWSSEDRDGALVIVGAVALLAGAYELVAVSLDAGQPVWRWCEPGARFGPCGPLTLVDGLICFTQESAVWALDAASGAVRWRANGAPRMCWAAPGALLRWHYDELSSLDAADAATRWSWRAGAPLIAALHAAERLIALDATGVLTALDASSGRVCWSRPLGALKKAPPRPQPERLCAVGAHVLVAWGEEVAGFALEDGASVGAREVRGGALAVCWGAGRLIARSEAGELLWSGPAPQVAAAQTVEVSALGEVCGLGAAGEVAWVWPRLLARGAARIAGEHVVIADAASVALARLADGEQVWSVALSASPDQGMAVMADAVLVNHSWSAVVALDLRTGRELWRSPHSPCAASLTFDAAELAVWPLKGALWALVGATGESLWSVEGASLLAVRGDAVWCAVGGRVEARDASSGALRWAWEAGPLDEVCAGVLDGERLVVTLEGGEQAALDAASGAVLEGLEAWDAEAEIEALGGESWRVAAARLGRMAGQGAALATLARDGREAARRFAEAHKIAWAEPAEAAGALGERLRAMSSCEGPPAAAVLPLAASAQRIALARRWSLGHRATHLIVSADGARVAVTAHEGGGSVIEATTGAIVERFASAPHAWPVAVDARGVLLCGHEGVALWEGGALAWQRSLGGYDHEAGLDGEQVWGMRGGGLARWERATGRWLGGRWLGERTMPALPATVAEGRGGRVTLEGASYSQSQHLRVATLDGGALVWREDARMGGVGGLSGALLWGDVAVAWGREGMVGRRVSDGALCWVERWRGCGDRSVAVYGERLWVACSEALWMYVASR